MGDRAVFCFRETGFDNGDYTGPGVYIHWLYGDDKAEAYMRLAKELNLRTEDPGVEAAHLAHLMLLNEGLNETIEVGDISDLDCNNYDNGLYVVKKWNIEKKFFSEEYKFDEKQVEKFLNGMRRKIESIYY